MSGEDDTFEIDLYGDEAAEPEISHTKEQNDQASEYNNTAAQQNEGTEDHNVQMNGDQTRPNEQNANAPAQGTKRKAPDDETEAQNGSAQQDYGQDYQQDDRPIDAGAQPALKISELQWWTTEEDLRGFCAEAGAEEELQDVAFGEHKINGKSRGEAYLEFSSLQASTAVKKQIDKANAEASNKEGGGPKLKIQTWFTPVGNPFRSKESAAGGGKKDYSAGGKFNNQGAYNNYNTGRGNYSGGGRGGGFNNRGGGYSNNTGNGMMGRGGGGAGWGMNNAGAPAAGFPNQMMGGGFPQMGYGNMNMGAGFGNMGAMGGMGGMGVMNRGGMMMGGRGNYGGGMPNMGMGMGMGGMNMNMMGGGRGGAGMTGRGGWGGAGAAGFQGGMQQQQQGYGGGGMGGSMSPQGQDMKKKPRMQ